MACRQAPRSGWLRAGLIALAASNTVVGAWLLFFPGSFYRDFPGLGMQWVSALPPYNEHMLTDYGGALLGLAAVLWLAALSSERRLMQGALVAQLVQGTPHFVYHLTRVEVLPTAQTIANQLVLAIPVVLPLVLLWLTARRRHADPDTAARPGGAGRATAGASP